MKKVIYIVLGTILGAIAIFLIASAVLEHRPAPLEEAIHYPPLASSSDAPTILWIFLGLFTNPSSSPRIDKWKYNACADNGISKNASLSIIVFANILFSAI
jgi:hypothetical protein